MIIEDFEPSNGSLVFKIRNSWFGKEYFKFDPIKHNNWEITAPQYIWDNIFEAIKDANESKCNPQSNLFPIAAALKYVVEKTQMKQIPPQISKIISAAQKCPKNVPWINPDLKQ